MSPDVIARRPELLFGPNPFIEAAAEFIPFDELASQLRRRPLDGVPWQTLPPRSREPLLQKIELQFAPHRNLLQPAADLQSLFRAGLERRNPLLLSERIRTVRVAVSQSRKDLLLAGQLDGGGGIWAGMTATGKSALIKRLMEIIVPCRVIPFGSSDAYGWDNLVHVPYLYIDFATNGSRGGILKRVLFALDQLLGTSFSDDFRKVTNIDTLLVEVCRQLSNVRCVLLIIDENQEQNFEDSPWKVEFLLFYLSLMNLGINVVLTGNPLAFGHLESFSQVMRRFSRAGHHRFEPAASADELWWRADFMPRVRKFDLVERWDIDADLRSQLEFRMSGGLPGLGTAIHVGAQLSALRRAGSSATEAVVTAADFESAEQSPRFVEQRRIAMAILGEVKPEEAPYIDVPHAGTHSGEQGGSSSSGSAGMSAVSNSSLSMVKKLLARHTMQQNMRAKHFVERLKSLQGLAPEDIRLLGVEQAHIEELRKQVAAIDACRPKAKPRRIKG